MAYWCYCGLRVAVCTTSAATMCMNFILRFFWGWPLPGDQILLHVIVKCPLRTTSQRFEII